ncbi:hypothetical protein NESM_000092700 [Novymonas esmeraldas]|uniref:Uncharacterized protein n=1 Tax=Novymonas esmeraldas TaxID=1808958 RepID=A0AAW0F3K8_9TRYP
MSSAAAAQLLRLLDGYVATDLDGQARKLMPNGSGTSARCSHTVALDAAEALALVPFSVAAGRHGESAASSFLLYLGDVVGRHLRAFISDISIGPSFADLRTAAARRCRGADDDGTHLSGRFDEDVHRGGGGPCVTLVAWTALEVYRLLAQDAESALRSRRSAGGSTCADAGVRTDVYVQWEREVRELAPAAVASMPWCDAADTGAGTSSGDQWREALRTVSAAASARLGDVAAAHPNLLYEMMCTEVLPAMLQRLQGCDDRSGRAAALARVHERLQRAPPRHDAERLQPVSSLFADAVVLLLGGAAEALVDSGGRVGLWTSGDGTTAHAAATPAHTSAIVAAAIGDRTAASLLGPAHRWIESIIPGRTSAEPPLLLPEEVRTEAVTHALDVCMRAVQLVSFPLCDGGDAEAPLSLASCGTAGGWLVPSTSSPLHVRTMPGFGVRRQRRAVVLPGLSIAATRVRSLAADCPQRTRAGAAPTPDAAVPAGTCVWSPAHALERRLSWTEEQQLSASAVASCCDDTHAPFTPVSAVGESHLRPVALLVLFESLPTDAVALVQLRAALDAEARVGWVVLVVQASVPKAAQLCVEEGWGTETRPVLLLSAVGRWGLQQLALRFAVQPNTAATDVRALRGVRRSCGGVGRVTPRRPRRVCGVAALPLRGQEYARPSSTSSDGSAVASPRDRSLRHTRYALGWSEAREHYLFIVGECDDDGDGDAAVSRSDAPAPPPSSPPASPSPPLPAMSMYLRSDAEETLSSEATDTASGGSSSSSSSSAFSDSITAAEAREALLPVWCGDAGVPVIPFVVSSVLVGAATRGAQQELLYSVCYHWRLLLHLLLLPEPLGRPVRMGGERGAVVTAIQTLDALQRQPANTSASPAAAAVTATGAPVRDRVLSALKDALLSHELLALQHGPAARTAEAAWEAIFPRPHATPDEAREADGTDSPVESWLAVQSALLALADCVGELSRTVVLGGGTVESGEAHRPFFFPMV